MQRKRSDSVHPLNGYGPEKVLCNPRFCKVNGYAPEKSRFNGHFVHLFIHFGMNGHQDVVFLGLTWCFQAPSESEWVWGGFCKFLQEGIGVCNRGFNLEEHLASFVLVNPHLRIIIGQTARTKNV